MTNSDTDRDVPGRLLLKLARLIFDEAALTSAVCPALADFQQEMRDAGTHRMKRLRARSRGYWAFSRLVAVAPFVFPAPPGSGVLTALVGRSGGRALALLLLALFTSMWPLFGWFVIGTGVGGMALAIVMRWWYDRHPSTLPRPDSSRDPQINLASISVQGNIGGLIFAAGSMVIVFIGLPGMRGFLLIPLIGGLFFAVGLFAWRAGHPSTRLRRNSIAGR